MMRKLELAPRSALGFGLIALTVCLLGVFSLIQVEKMSTQAGGIADKWLPNIVTLSDMVKTQLQAHVVMTQLVLPFRVSGECSAKSIMLPGVAT